MNCKSTVVLNGLDPRPVVQGFMWYNSELCGVRLDVLKSNKSIIWYKRAYASRYLQDANQTYTLLCETNIIFGCEI